MRKESTRPVGPADVLAVVRSSGPLLIGGKPTALRKICGAPAIRILADRLRKVPQIRRTVLVLDEAEPRTMAAAKRLGWSVVLRNKRRAADAATLLRLVRCRRVAFFSLQSPFVDPETTASLLDDNTDVSVLWLIEGRDFGPSLVATRNFAVRAALLRLLMRGTVGWQQAAETLRPLTPSRDVRLDVGHVSRFFRTGAAAAELLGDPNFTLRQLQDRAADPDFERQLAEDSRKKLHAEMLCAADPDAVNLRLNEVECNLGCDELLSFPTIVGLNMTPVCNARCVFCIYQPSMLKERDCVTVGDLKQMTWLRYVRDFAIWAGIGDSLVNPEFLDCYRYLRAAHPHLATDFATNGIRMTREICDEFAGSLSQYKVSLNAARRETWEKLMRAKGFDNVCETFAYLARRRREVGAKTPRMTLSMVLTRANVEEAVEFVELAARLGADATKFVHYISTTLDDHRDLAPEDSLYHDKAKADYWLQKAAVRGAELGLEVTRPLPFAADSAHIQCGVRVPCAPAPCRNPWSTCYLTVDEQGRRQMIFCCPAFHYGVKYQKGDLTEENFRKLWNHPGARHFRRTVNKNGANPICTHCQSVDRFDPENNRTYAGVHDGDVRARRNGVVMGVSGAVGE
ncbi:MAG: radical SAM protein [Thermoguttaceae bacterium]